MKALLINGSPRKGGNTVTAVKTVTASIQRDMPGCVVEQMDAASLNLSGCIHCDGCRRNGGTCVLKDGGAEVMEKLFEAQRIIFTTPVYWWGVTSQLKAIIDRMYSKAVQMKNLKMKKEIGIVAIGEDKITGEQYDLISRQMQCICDYMGWDLVMDVAICAAGPNDLAGDEEQLMKLRAHSWK